MGRTGDTARGSRRARWARFQEAPFFNTDVNGSKKDPTNAEEDGSRKDPTPDGGASRASVRISMAVTCGCIAFTLLAGTIAFEDMAGIAVERIRDGRWASAAGQVLFMSIAACLLYGGLVYQATRALHFLRVSRHRAATAEELDAFRDGGLPTLTVLVPSYREEPKVVAKTLLSAALQSYDKHRVVLLIDDPPESSAGCDELQLRRARALPGRIHALLDPQAERLRGELDGFEARRAAGPVNVPTEAWRLSHLFEQASDWFAMQAGHLDSGCHADSVFIEQVLDPWRAELQCSARHFERCYHRVSAQEVARAYRRLAALFDVEITSFERKQFLNLSHAANKAMNLNSYLSLLGGRWKERETPEGRRLEPAGDGRADLEVPDTDYVITLDADSLLTPDYALRLVHVAEQPGNERMAVIQTPYSAFPDAPGALERIAGATTDIQYNIHQGFSAWNATYWVGANAVLRKAALEDIAQTLTERGHRVTMYIQDRTVIEDTESTVDLIEKGWTLFNYPQRLAYSATPPDFGSLVIQRRRWANGGLIILPKLVRHLLRGPMRLSRAGEAFFRIHYLASIAAVNVGLLIILAVPFVDAIRNWWLPLTALPYFALYARDLQRAGYRLRDLVGVYSLNLVLIPVNLGGVLKSLQQGFTGEKIPFGRTPKVRDRTASPPVYVAALYLLLVHWFGAAAFDLYSGHWAHAAFAAANALLLGYGIATFVGLRDSWRDLRARGEQDGGPRVDAFEAPEDSSETTITGWLGPAAGADRKVATAVSSRR